jgi:hypothetical protein
VPNTPATRHGLTPQALIPGPRGNLRPEREPSKVVNFMDALRRSDGTRGASAASQRRVPAIADDQDRCGCLAARGGKAKGRPNESEGVSRCLGAAAQPLDN